MYSLLVLPGAVVNVYTGAGGDSGGGQGCEPVSCPVPLLYYLYHFCRLIVLLEIISILED